MNSSKRRYKPRSEAEEQHRLRDYKACGATCLAKDASNQSFSSFNGCCKRQLKQNEAKHVCCRRLALRLAILWLLCMATTEAKMCDPKNPRSCMFMGKCVDIRTIKQFNPRLNASQEEKYYICRCPSMSCYDLEEDVICVQDGKVQENYYNDMCRRIAECEIQRPLKKICRGVCGEPSCIPEEESNNERCSEEIEDYCHNNGLCLVTRKGPRIPFCRCPSGYVGSRCKGKSVYRKARHEVYEKR